MRESIEPILESGWSRTEILLLKILGTAAFAFLTILSAQIRIPLPFTPVPMTLQTFVAPLAGGFLGAALGSGSMLLYLALGLLGAPVFAQATGGWEFVYAPTSGFLAGMILAAFVVGLVREKTKSRGMLLAGLVTAHVLIFACGISGFMMVLNTGFQEAFAKAVAPFLLGDVLKITASFLILISYDQLRKKTNL